MSQGPRGRAAAAEPLGTVLRALGLTPRPEESPASGPGLVRLHPRRLGV